jgi:hypothetical protein
MGLGTVVPSFCGLFLALWSLRRLNLEPQNPLVAGANFLIPIQYGHTLYTWIG